MSKISIIVPVYNVETYLKECIDSLVNQTLKDIEIILVDDGSKDKSGLMCDEYASVDKRIKVLHQSNSGQSAARNRGLEIARGEYIMFVDSDDYIDTKACEILYNIAKESGVDIINGDLLNEKDKIYYSDFRKISHDEEIIDIRLFLKEKIDTQTYDIVPWLYFIHREFLINNNMIFEEGYFYEDQLWTMQLLSREGKIIKIRYPYYYYRMNRSGSTTNYMYLKKGTDAAHICNLMNEYISCIPDNNMKKYFHIVLLMSVFQFVQVWLRLSKRDRQKAYDCLNKSTVESSLKYNYIYKNLYDEVKIFWEKNKWYAFKYDTKRKLRKVLGR